MNSQWHGGKGSQQRPQDKEKFNENYDRIFGKKPTKNDDNKKTK